MVKYELTLQKRGEDVSRFLFQGKTITIGRSHGADLVLPDALISRQHARIRVVDGQAVIEDLESTNGIVVNGEQVHRVPLAPGDVITLGDYSIRVREADALQMSDRSRSGTQISFEAADRLLQRMVCPDSSEPLPILYKAAQLLAKPCTLDELLEEVLKLVMDAVPVARGYIATRFDDQEPFRIRAGSGGRTHPEDIPFSSTLADHVYSTRDSILTEDAQADPRFSGSDSVLGHDISAAMCVPLYGHSRPLGVIYVDAKISPSPFDQTDLELLTAIGRVVGVAVENAKLVEEKVERERLAAIGEAVACINHCLRNILTGVRAGGEMIEAARKTRNWDRLDYALNLMSKSLGRFETLAGNLLAYARNTELDLQPTSLYSLVEEAVAAMQEKARHNGVALEFHGEQPSEIPVDSRQMYRVILNLIDNAIDACSEKGGTITVECRQDHSGVFIKVRDTGVGIAPEILSRIPKPFFTTKGSRGTGLGLASSYRIVRQHGGEISIRSKKGAGSVFTIFLPCQSAERTPLLEQLTARS